MSKPRLPNVDGTWSCNICRKDKPGEKFYRQPETGKPKAACKDCQRRKMNEARTNRRRNGQPTIQVEPPTPEQIAELTAEIRSTWTDSVRNSRAGFDPSMYGVETRVVSGHRIGRNGMWEINNADDK